MPPKLERPSPVYLQIADGIRKRIDNGSLQPGDIVPSVRDIVREYGVAMATAQRALAALKSEGYVHVEPGIGSVVSTEEERGRGASSRVAKARNTGKIYPEGQYARIIEASMVKAIKEVAYALNLKSGQLVIRRRRVTFLDDGQAVSASTSYFRGSWAKKAPRLLEPERIRAGTFSYIAEVLGKTVDGWRDQFEASFATSVEAEDLAVEEGTPVLRGWNWVYDGAGDILEYGESVSVGRVTYQGP